MIIKNILIGTLLMCTWSVYAQDPEFSQLFANKLILNPAFCATHGESNVGLNYRNELPNGFGSFVNYNVSYDQYVDAFHGGWGINISREQQGENTVSLTNIDLIYSYIFEASHDFTISAALQAGYSMFKIDPSEVILPDMINTSTGEIINSGEQLSTITSNYVDFSFGVLAWYKYSYFGGSVDHITSPVIAESEGSETHRLARKYTAHIGRVFEFYNTIYKLDWTLSPNILYQHQGSYNRFNIGLYLERKYFSFGLWTRHDISFDLKSIIPLLGYSNDYISISYSYDIPIQKYGENKIKMGAHEVTFMLNFQYKSKRKRIRAIKCPKF